MLSVCCQENVVQLQKHFSFIKNQQLPVVKKDIPPGMFFVNYYSVGRISIGNHMIPSAI